MPVETTPKPLTQTYWEWVESSIEPPDGFGLPYAFVLSVTGEVICTALDVTPEQCYQYFLVTILSEAASEAIIALDCFTKPGQGTTHSDVLTGHHFLLGKFRPFIIEYSLYPKVVEPMNFDNFYWNKVLTERLVCAQADLLRRVVDA